MNRKLVHTPRALPLLVLAAAMALPLRTAAQESFDLSVKSIMRGPELVGDPPSNVRWTDDGRWVYFRWKPGGLPWYENASLYRVRADAKTPEKLDDSAADSLGALIAEGPVSPDRRMRAVAYMGDVFLIDRSTGALRRLTSTRAAETAPSWSPDSRRVYFASNDNLFALDLSTGTLEQLSDIRTGPAPKEPKEAEGQRRLLEEQQRELFESVRVQEARREELEERRKAREARGLHTIYLDADEHVTGINVDPAGRYAILEVGKEAKGARRAIIPDYVTRSGYTEPREVRTLVGDVQSEGRVGLVSLDSGTVSWLPLAPAASDSAAKHAGHAALAQTNFLGWNRDASLGLIVATAYDFKDRWFYAVERSTGHLRLLAHDHDDAWLQGPCDDWSLEGGCAGWMSDGRAIYFVSERDGYSHLYTVDDAGRNVRQLTSGKWEVQRARLSQDGTRFYLQTSESSPYETQFYSMPASGGARTRITGTDGFNDATPSPDERLLAVVHSTGNRPPELYIADNRAGAAMRQITDSPTAEWKRGPWIQPQIVEFTARDGVRVPARIYRPADLGAPSNGAGVVFVHGAGYLQNVVRGWSSYYREYMFHHLLASLGYTVLDVDYRGSAGYGRDWRTAVYRHMGGKDLDDIVDGARYLSEHDGVDARRIGVYGGSYGGFMTLMALFTQPHTFAAGAALRSVTDWAHYNHWYTSRILNLPQGDTLAYRQSSPIYFAEGLADPLLIAHGMVDTNVHFQDVVRLAQRLIELGKTDWELAVYPVESHGFVAPSSWTDEYRRILELFETRVRNHAQAAEGR